VKVAILGIGLIGGSIGLAARRRGGATVCGYDPDAGVRARALELGAIDAQAPDLAAAVAGAEVVFVAAPVGELPATVRDALACAGPACVVSDVGSTKRLLGAAATDARFVGGHPLAGAETAGVEHAREDLFDGAIWYLTPTQSTSEALYERLRRLLVILGAQPAAIDAARHDRLMATFSHLPHVLANLLVVRAGAHDAGAPNGGEVDRGRVDAGEVDAGLVDAGEPRGGEALSAAGPSFRDATRVAGANTAIWTDIYISNRDALIAEIDAAIAGLGEVRALLHAGDAAALAAWNERARAARAALLSDGRAGGPTP
jgi:prephenate dehydrogenase